MIDYRIQKMAKQLIRYSINLKKGEKILLDITDYAEDFAQALIKEVYDVGGIPFVNLESAKINRALLIGATQEQLDKRLEYELKRMKDMDAYIAVRKAENISELSDVTKEKMSLFNKFSGKLHLEERVRNTRWCILRYPTSSMAQQAKMSTEAFEDYYFKICSLNYDKLSKAMDPLKELMDKTDKVRIIAKNTDLSFSLKGRLSGKCDGHANIPDGEVCTTPVKNSVNGTITYNVPSNNNGFLFTDISLTFEDGKIIKAVSNDTERLNKILDIDEGARYVGEFAIGVNPFVNRYIIDTLFDEKMAGSIHFTPGYGEGNDSNIHWDIVQGQTEEFGGGEIWFDGKLIRKDGLFVIDELKGLNPLEFAKTLNE